MDIVSFVLFWWVVSVIAIVVVNCVEAVLTGCWAVLARVYRFFRIVLRVLLRP